MIKLPKNADYQFLVRALNNNLSPEEKEYFEDWLAESEKNREDFGSITLLWDRFDSIKTPLPPNAETQWGKILFALNHNGAQEVKQEKILQSETKKEIDTTIYQLDGYQTGYLKSILTSRMFQIAAVLLVIATAGLLTLRTDFLKRINIPQSQNQVTNLIEVKTKPGEKVTLTLSDGSKVHLNTLSKLTFPEFFSDSTRDVELEGEAYFSVTSNKNKPFTVKSGNTVTIVRGTEFNIKNRGESVSVVVVKGAVDAYSPKLEEIYKLKKGEIISYNEQTGFSLPHKADIRPYLAWRKDKFSFKQTPLVEVMEEIERYYNFKTIFENDSLKYKTITGLFNSGSINNILSIISLTLDLKIKNSKGNIIISKN
jgi:ferric-dicitrate binding protein FerR (iron transport regulator)